MLICGYTSIAAFLVSMATITMAAVAKGGLGTKKTGYEITWFVVSVLSWALFNATSKTFLIVTCNKFVFSCNQTCGEVVRAGVTMAGRLLAAFGATFIHAHILTFTVCNSLVAFVFVVAMTWMRKRLSEPTACF